MVKYLRKEEIKIAPQKINENEYKVFCGCFESFESDKNEFNNEVNKLINDIKANFGESYNDEKSSLRTFNFDYKAYTQIKMSRAAFEFKNVSLRNTENLIYIYADVSKIDTEISNNVFQNINNYSFTLRGLGSLNESNVIILNSIITIDCIDREAFRQFVFEQVKK